MFRVIPFCRDRDWGLRLDGDFICVINLGVPDSRVQLFSHCIIHVQGGPGVMGEDLRPFILEGKEGVI